MGSELAESHAGEAGAFKAKDEDARRMAGERSSHLCGQAVLKARLELAPPGVVGGGEGSAPAT